MKRLISMTALPFLPLLAAAQLAVTVSPMNVIGQKAIVPLAMKNSFAEKIETARAVVFLMDNHDKVIAQSTKWVIGGSKDRPALEPKQETTFNFVVQSSVPITTTNLSAKVTFTRIVLKGGKLADPAKDVQITRARARGN